MKKGLLTICTFSLITMVTAQQEPAAKFTPPVVKKNGKVYHQQKNKEKVKFTPPVVKKDGKIYKGKD